MFGFYGRLLEVDLTGQKFSIKKLEQEKLDQTLGGKGLGSKLLLENNPPGIDPLHPENRLILTAGPAAGTRVWGGCRYAVFTKSPLTGFYTESYAGGRFPEALDAAGFDAIIIKGASGEPTALSVHPDGCEFYSAQKLWGMDTYSAEKLALENYVLNDRKYKRKGAAVIGPAGENRVRFAVMENDYWRSIGRTGPGAVMGAKNLKALVFQGDCKREVSDPKGLEKYSKEFMHKNKELPGVKAYQQFGTTMMVAMLNNARAFPSRYWKDGTCAHWEKISGEHLHQKHQVKAHACRKCFMACGRMSTLTSGRHKGLSIEGPEYETIFAFGGLCMIQEIEEIVFLNDLCDRLGMDTITAGNLCAFSIEASRQKKIDLDLDYGDAGAIADLLEDIAYRRGFGKDLSDGIIPAAKKWDMQEQAVHVKGLEPAGYDPRRLKGMGLSYAVSDRGACHLRTTFYKPELSGMIAPEQILGKAEMVIDFEDRLTIFDCLILCRFYRDLYTWEELGTVLELLTGKRYSRKDLQETAARIVNWAREFNLQEGLTPEEDQLPGKLLDNALPDGSRITKEEMNQMLAEYYDLRGWKLDRQ